MNKWRLLDTGVKTAAENMALDETLLESKGRGASPNTIRFLQFYPPAVLVGYHQNIEEEVRVDFCKKTGIDINRRITGGGAIYFDEPQLGWEVIANKSFFKLSVASPSFFEHICEPLIYALKKLGVPASFRAKNDIEVEGRKISGTGGTEESGAFLFQGTLLTDFDVDTMMRALRIPIEKLKDKEKKSVMERVTCLSTELGYLPALDGIKKVIKEGFEKLWGIKLMESGLTIEEEKLFNEKLPYFSSNKWIYKVKSQGSQNIHAIHKADGGLIRVSLALRSNRIQSTLITGDFFIYPKRAIFDLEAELKDIPATEEAVANKINKFFEKRAVQIPGIEPQDFINTINTALEKSRLTKFGLSLKEADRIFVVNGRFEEILHNNPSYFLAPYCAKLKSCPLRYKRECSQCGKCSVGDAYRTAGEKSIKAITIRSFEDLMQTLERFKKAGVSSYIGSCCEAFYRKHKEDFERSKVPGILIDIDNTTCYDLGLEKKAYDGKFESQTELELSILTKVMNLINA